MPDPNGVLRDRKRVSPDAVAVVALLVVAFIARRHVLPHNGLFGDDAWQAFGAEKGSLSNLITVGFSAPGFTTALMVWHRIVHSPERMADLPFVAGVITPPLLYGALRRSGYTWSISLLLGVALACDRVLVVYSGRVKSYVIDVLIVLAITTVLPRVLRLHFGPREAAVWIVGSFAVGFFSPFALVAGGVAGILLVLRPVDDRAMRAVAVAGQAVLCGVLSVALRRTYNVKLLQDWWKTKQNGFIVFSAQPLTFLSHILKHVHRVAAVFSGGPSWWATLIMIVALVALIADAWVQRNSARGLRAQYLLILLVVAIAASALDILPFGPSPTHGGDRLSAWLVPIFAIGAATVLRRTQSAFATGAASRTAFDGMAVLVSVILVAGASNGGPSYPTPGSRTATNYVEGRLAPRDAVFVEKTAGMFSYAIVSRLPVMVRPTPTNKVAFAPEFRDRRVHFIQFMGVRGKRLVLTSAADSRNKFDISLPVRHADRVFLYIQAAVKGIASFYPRDFAAVLAKRGFTKQSDTAFGVWHVMVWRRSATPVRAR